MLKYIIALAVVCLGVGFTLGVISTILIARLLGCYDKENDKLADKYR